MDPDAVAALTGFLGFCGFILIGVRMFFNYRIKRLQAQGSAGHPRELEEGLAEVRDQLYLLRTDLSDLQERVEFTERVLARGRDDARLPESH
jgi:hypothetical protein